MGETIYIALCNNEENVYQTINRKLEKYFIEKNYKFELSRFFSIKEFFKSKKEFKILLLDIDILDINWIEVTRTLVNRSKLCKIIVITDKVEQCKEAFKIGAYRLITKPINVDDFNEALEDTFKSLLGCRKTQVKFKNSFCQVLQCNIDYIEACGDYVKVYINDMICESDKTLKAWIDELDSQLFAYCHKSYIVNIAKIKQIYTNRLILKNEKEIPVSRRRSSYILQRFMEYNISNH